MTNQKDNTIVQDDGVLVVGTRQFEERIALRTADLSAQVKDLSAQNKSMIGREVKMVALKQEIRDLKDQIACDPCNQINRSTHDSTGS